MSDFRLNEMTPMQLDVLKEIANIGAGNATTALSSLLNTAVNMEVPKIEMLEFKELADVIGGAENLVVGILLTLQQSIEGMMMFLVDTETAHKIVGKLLGSPISEDMHPADFSEMDLSAISEIGNIIAGSYMSSISTFMNMPISISVPYLAIDMAGAILSVPAIEFGKMSDHALLIESQFGDSNTVVNGYFILIPKLESFETIFKAIGLL